MESFCSSLKTEHVVRRTFPARDAAGVFAYIDRFYNPKRRHLILDYLSPVAFEERAMLSLLAVQRTGIRT